MAGEYLRIRIHSKSRKERDLRLSDVTITELRFVKGAVPSRGGVEAFQRFRCLIEGLIGNIQGTFGIPDWSPVRYLHRSLSRREVYATTVVVILTSAFFGVYLWGLDLMISAVVGRIFAFFGAR